MWVVVAVFVCAWHYYGDRHCVSVYNWKRYQNAGAEEEPTLHNINYAIGTHSRGIPGTLQIRPPPPRNKMNDGGDVTSGSGGGWKARKMAQWHKRAFPVLFLTIKNCFIR